LNPGDKVDVLEQRDNWYRIKRGEQLQGWMEESTILTNTTMEKARKLAVDSQAEPPQNTAVLREDANLRMEPGRSTTIIRKLESGAKLEVLERATTPRPGSDAALDAWLKVRVAPTEVGWVLANLVDFDVPAELAGYTEGFIYTAVKQVHQVNDPIAGEIHWYVIGERGNGIDPHLDFDGIRVFTWNMRKHRYETAYRQKKLRGVYPIEIGEEKGNPTFRIHELDPDEKNQTAHNYVMYGVIVRPQK
jgi:SH3-like domain-containing protein